MKKHLEKQINTLMKVVESLDGDGLTKFTNSVTRTIKNNGSIIVSGLGKNVPICEKFVGTLISLGIRAYFLHTDSALHGDLGLVRKGDIVIILSKSGETSESVKLVHYLMQRNVNIWLLTCKNESTMGKLIENKIVLNLDHEGDPWNVVPNNSSIAFLMILQGLAMQLIDELNISLETFKNNHPGGYIGFILGGSEAYEENKNL
jgi:arabinose-5-phosphate isomerase